MNQSLPDERILQFIHHLRDRGFVIGIQETQDTVKVLQQLNYPDHRTTHHTLRALACRNHEEWQQFDQYFREYWFPDIDQYNKQDRPISIEPRLRESGTLTSGISGGSNADPYTSREISGILGSGAGRQRTIANADFRFLNDRKAMYEVEQMAERLASLLKRKLTRRHLIRPSGPEISIRHTLRKNLAHGGLPVDIQFKTRKKEHPHLVMLHDVSHSMTWNNPLLFRFVRGLIRTFPTSEAFVFHTRLFRVTDLYRERSIEIMKQRLESRNHLWLGGTCIASSLDFFNRKYGDKTINEKSIILIISDGFDTDREEYLAESLANMKARANKIIWINPMLGREGYNPDKNSMLAAKPFLDRLAAAHNIDSLRDTILYIAQHCR